MLLGLGAYALIAALCVLPLLLIIAIPLFPLVLSLLPRFVAWPIGLLVVALLALALNVGFNRRRAEIYQDPAAALDEYKRILSGLLPPEFLTPDGFLKRRDGMPEPICIVTASGLSAVGVKEEPDYSGNSVISVGAGFMGGLPYKVLRHRLEKGRDALPVEEYGILQRFVGQKLELLGSEDEIDLRSGATKGTLAHETFHDIQGFLYDNHPEIIDALQQACFARQEIIAKWHRDPDSAPWTQSGYQLRHIFPETVGDVPYRPAKMLEEAVLFLDTALQHRDISAATWESVLIESHKDLGRLEAIPLMISAAACGNDGAKKLLGSIFADAGLRSDLKVWKSGLTNEHAAATPSPPPMPPSGS